MVRYLAFFLLCLLPALASAQSCNWNYYCESWYSEDCSSCPSDCGCSWPQTCQYNGWGYQCQTAAYCGNGICDSGEDCSNCSQDCGCTMGNSCQYNGWSYNCAPSSWCGNWSCETGEDCNNCWNDCGCTMGAVCAWDGSSYSCQWPTPTPTPTPCQQCYDGIGIRCDWYYDYGCYGNYCYFRGCPDAGTVCDGTYCSTPTPTPTPMPTPTPCQACWDGTGMRCDWYWDVCDGEWCYYHPCDAGNTCTGVYCVADTPTTPTPAATDTPTPGDTATPRDTSTPGGPTIAVTPNEIFIFGIHEVRPILTPVPIQVPIAYEENYGNNDSRRTYRR